MRAKVWLSLLIISSLLFSACADTAPAASTVEMDSSIPLSQDTLEMVPDFSYVVSPQKPHVFIDRMGYRTGDKKMAFFYGENIENTFSVQETATGKEVYSGKMHKVKDIDGKHLYVGDFTGLSTEGSYVLNHTALGDSYEFIVEDSIYEHEFLVLQRSAREYNYTNVSDLTYVLANLMFIQEMFHVEEVDSRFIEEKIAMLLNSQDVKSGAFFSEIFTEPVGVSETVAGKQDTVLNSMGTISLTTTAQMAGILAQYSVLYMQENPIFASQCLNASQKAYQYMEKYKANTDTDAWYYAAVQLYRATGQFKYRNAIAEYDAVDPALYSNSVQGYTILADFIYLSTPRGTDYVRCNALLDKYMEKAQAISVSSSRENFYVLENIDAKSDKEILEDMIILGIVNHVLSGQEYAGIERNYVHYLSGVNMETENYLFEKMAGSLTPEGMDIANISRLLLIFGNLSQE